VRATVAIQNRHIAKPDTGLDVGEGDLFARQRGRTDPNRTFGAGDPFLGRVAARRDQVAVFESLDVCASEYVVSE